MKLFADIYLDRPEEEIKVTVIGNLYRGNPRDMDDPSEIHDIRAFDAANKKVELTEEEVEQAEEALFRTLE